MYGFWVRLQSRAPSVTWIGLLFTVIPALVAFASIWFLRIPGQEVTRGCLLGTVLLVVTFAGTLLIPWERWGRVALIFFPIVGLTADGALGVTSPHATPAFTGYYTITFIFIGMSQPRWTGLRLLPAAITSWFFATDGIDQESVTHLVINAGVWVLVAELVASRTMAAAKTTSTLSQQVHLDPLTGIGNRRALQLALADLRIGATVLFIDLDHFKRFNDTAGHDAGDRVIRRFAQTLQDVTRGDDVVARYGGEEFVVITHGACEPESLHARLRVAWTEREPTMTFSAGAAVHLEGDSPQSTLVRADRAMLTAKRAGRDRLHTVEDLLAEETVPV